MHLCTPSLQEFELNWAESWIQLVSGDLWEASKGSSICSPVVTRTSCAGHLHREKGCSYQAHDTDKQGSADQMWLRLFLHWLFLTSQGFQKYISEWCLVSCWVSTITLSGSSVGRHRCCLNRNCMKVATLTGKTSVAVTLSLLIRTHYSYLGKSQDDSIEWWAAVVRSCGKSSSWQTATILW